MKPKEIIDILERYKFEWRLISPNNPNNPNQWYECKLGEENPKDWRIDAKKKELEITCFKDGTFNSSWHFYLSGIANKYGIELCDKYNIGIDFWGHNEDFSRILITEIEKVFEKKTEWEARAIEFLAECIDKISG